MSDSGDNQERYSLAGEELDDPFETWLRETIPATPVDETRQEMHLAILKERMRLDQARRRRRMRLTCSVLPLVVVVLLVGGRDVGSDGFDLVQLEQTTGSEAVVSNVFRGDGFNVPAGSTARETQEFNQQLAADDGVVVRAVGWEVRGKNNWSLMREYNVHGQARTAGADPRLTPSHWTGEMLVFLTGPASGYVTQIEAGLIAPTGSVVKELDGEPYKLDYWTIPTADFGEVTYYAGPPVGAQPAAR